MLTLDSLVEISKKYIYIWLISTSFILISKPLKHNTTKTKDSTWRFAHEEKPWFTASVLLVLSITPISTQKIWDNNPTYSIDLEKTHSHPGMCVHLICAGHGDITPAYLLQAEKHYNIKPSSLWEKKILMLCGLHISDHFLCAPGGRMLMESLMVWSIHIGDQRPPVTEKHNLLWFTILFDRKYDSNIFSLQINWLSKC